MLACDDRCQVEPGFATPVADVLARLAGSQRISDLGVRVELRVRSIEQGMLEDRLIHCNTHLLDTVVEESEVGPARLGPLPSSLRKGDRLAPEQVEALANGTELPQDHVGRRAMALAITRAKLRALNDVARREEGAPVEAPVRPARPASPQAAASTGVPRLSERRDV